MLCLGCGRENTQDAVFCTNGRLPTIDFHRERRSYATHESTTDPEARLLRQGKGKEAKLVCMAHALMENPNGLLVDLQTTQATGMAERDTVPEIVPPTSRVKLRLEVSTPKATATRVGF